MTLAAGLPALPSIPARPAEELAALAIQGAQELEGRDPYIVVEWAAQTFGERLCVASSMGDAVTAHLVSQVVPGVDVLFLDTGLHFAETLGTRDAVDVVLPVNVKTVRPQLDLDEQERRYGSRLWERAPDLCCQLRKVEPLRKALTGYDAWVTGVRRTDSRSRARAAVVEWDAGRGKVKVNPIVGWSPGDVAHYVDYHRVLVNPLVQEGYASIGCRPCTRKVDAGEDPRAGRWAGSAKTECGIHT